MLGPSLGLTKRHVGFQVWAQLWCEAVALSPCERPRCGDIFLQAAVWFSSTVGEWPPKARVGCVLLSPVVTWGLQTQ